MPKQKITTFLWFNQDAEEAMLQMNKLDIQVLKNA
jgi:predicted 3-demethylubiquinone-9 3-methyltransferase (glyoxalase superfamily)